MYQEVEMHKLIQTTLFILSLTALSACSPEIGSEKWCAQLKEKPKGDWTVNEAADYTKHCIF
jgi:hypothetical protein